MESKPLIWALRDYAREVNARVAPNVASAVLAGTLAGILECLPSESQRRIQLAVEAAVANIRANN